MKLALGYRSLVTKLQGRTTCKVGQKVRVVRVVAVVLELVKG